MSNRPPKRKGDPIAIRLEPAVLEELRRRAALENRTLTNYLETMIKRELQVIPAQR